MKLIIFGASGTIGKQLVLQALSLGHSVTAFGRDKTKLQEFTHPHLHFFEGDVLNSADVERAISGQDAVFCALGNGRKGIVRSQGTHNIIRAMEKKGIKRLICQTTLGAGDSRSNLTFFWKHLMFGWLLKQAYLDHELQEKYITRSSLDWTIVRPAAFTDGKATGHYRHGFSATDKTLQLKISRADVALFMLTQLSTDEYLKKTSGLSY
ncbi:SDR family oxidoreductase [Rhodocytophaga aerolata]|uniref:SDR family oxidoreductase n=1 Tax=Rhodocytophaga aerolata TaxID=455078 RepID=A0ABT8R3E1_9BACT|nr:SDR family oxidoreductase [Rhodocytophaga aerolata]MDO1446449.1 SDR family oxidoreductase [Rhodocytophaga aerolata]